jgi:hypothetical protein
MKNKIVLLLLLSSSFCFAKEGLKKFNVGIHFSPEYSYRIIKADAAYRWLTDVRNDLEIPKFGYSFGVDIMERFWKKTYGTIGISASNKGYQTDKNNLVYNDPEPGAPVRIQTRFSYWYLEVPLKINYQVFDSSSFYISVGGVPALEFYEKTKSIYTNEDGSKDRTSDHILLGNNSNKLNLAGYIGIGYLYKWKSWSAIKIEPFFKCQLLKLNDSYVHEYFYSIGLDLGFYFTKGN